MFVLSGAGAREDFKLTAVELPLNQVELEVGKIQLFLSLAG